MRLTNRQIVQLNEAMQALKTSACTSAKAWHWTTSDGRPPGAVLRNMHRLAERQAQIEKLERAIIARFSAGGIGLRPNDPNFTRCWEALDQMVSTEHDIELEPFRLDQLTLDARSTSLSLLAALVPVIDFAAEDR